MPIDTIEFKGDIYPAFQASGNASRFAFAFAQEVCNGVGFDIGYSKAEWKFPGAIGIEPSIDFTYDAMNLPDIKVDYIFSSHMVEHFKGNFSDLLDYWTSKIKSGGVLFLYLPHPSQRYWLPFHNKKHIHSLSPELIRLYLQYSEKYKNIYVSGVDLNNSFMVMAEKL